MVKRLSNVLSLVAFACVLGMASCARSINGDVPVIDGHATVISAERAATPSVDGLSRDGWPRWRTGWQSGAVTHTPTYSEPLRLDEDDARKRGAFPTSATVTLQSDDGGTETLESLLAIPHVGWLILKAPYEMVRGHWPWSSESTEASGYARVPESGPPPATGIDG